MKIYSLALLFILLSPFASTNTDVQQKLYTTKNGPANIVFKSTDGGQTWQDISEGLPENLREDVIQRDAFFANDSGLYLHVGKGLYRSEQNSTAPFWQKESCPDEHSGITSGRTGIFAYNYGGQCLQKINGTNSWSPMYTNLQEKDLLIVYETANGTVFIGSDKGIFKSINRGKTWKQVHTRGGVMKVVESNGILMATSRYGILRSADDGENWDIVISEGGVGIDIAQIGDGFAAINYNTTSKTRRVRASYDGGATWQPIDAGLSPTPFIVSIIQVGKYLFCGHTAGIFRSSDNGRTWQLMLPSIENKVFNLSVSGNVIYAIPRNAGC